MNPRGSPSSSPSRRKAFSPAVSGHSKPDGDGVHPPGDRDQVRNQHPAIPPRHKAAERDEREEAEVGQHHRIGEDPVDHALQDALIDRADTRTAP